MAARNFAVLVSRPDESGELCAEGVEGQATGSRPRATGWLDASSGADLLEALWAQGHAGVLIPVEEGLGARLTQMSIDACVVALHGPLGGSGKVQALLDRLGLPYSGPDGATVSLAFDKGRARQVLAHHNLPVPTTVALGPGQPLGRRAIGFLGWPCVLKPRRGAHSLGLTRLERRDDVAQAVIHALAVDRELILERAISGVEVQVVLAGERVLGAMQVERSLDDPSAEAQICPPRLGRTRMAGITNLARRAVTALGIRRGLTRVDIMMTDRQNEMILEVEPLPPMHRDGVVARVARASGVDYVELVAELIGELDPRVTHDPRANVAAVPALR